MPASSTQSAKKDDVEQPWGLTLTHTRHIIHSFDILSILLGPNERKWPPISGQDIAGEIRPRTKTLQHIFRSVMVFRGEGAQMEKIRSLTKSMIKDIDDFLNQGAVQILIANGNQVKTSVLGQGGRAKIERLRGAMHPAVSRRLVEQMRELEEKIGEILVGVENVVRPVRIIQLNRKSQVVSNEIEVKSWVEKLGYVLQGVMEVLWQIPEDVAQFLISLMGSWWKWKWKS